MNRKSFAICFTLLVVASAFVAVIRAYRLNDLRQNTISSLSWGSGSSEDQQLLTDIRGYITLATRTELQKPKVVSVTHYDYDHYFEVGVDCIGLPKLPESIKFVFKDGSTCILPIREQNYDSSLPSLSDSLLIEMGFVDTEFPERVRSKAKSEILEVVLLHDGKAISHPGPSPVFNR